jgi:hypothetical protein
MESTLDGVTCDSELEEFRGSMVWGGKAGRWQIQVRVECWEQGFPYRGCEGAVMGDGRVGKRETEMDEKVEVESKKKKKYKKKQQDGGKREKIE